MSNNEEGMIEKEQGFVKKAESNIETKAENWNKAVEMLENPPNDNFLMGLQTFIAWVKALVKDD